MSSVQQSSQPRRCLFLLVRQNVAVGVPSDAHVAVSKTLCHDVNRLSSHQEQRSSRVPHAVEADDPDPRLLDETEEAPLPDVVRLKRFAYQRGGKAASSTDYKNTCAVADTLYAHTRVKLPYGLTVIGY